MCQYLFSATVINHALNYLCILNMNNGPTITVLWLEMKIAYNVIAAAFFPNDDCLY